GRLWTRGKSLAEVLPSIPIILKPLAPNAPRDSFPQHHTDEARPEQHPCRWLRHRRGAKIRMNKHAADKIADALADKAVRGPAKAEKGDTPCDARRGLLTGNRAGIVAGAQGGLPIVQHQQGRIPQNLWPGPRECRNLSGMQAVKSACGAVRLTVVGKEPFALVIPTARKQGGGDTEARIAAEYRAIRSARE